MNLYFILEGDQTEPKIYPKWIEFVLPKYTRVDFESESKNNNYYIFSGGGIPSIYRHTVNAIKNINADPIYDKLIVCLDGEEIGTENRKAELIEFIAASGVSLIESCTLHIIVQNICIETWFLGNRRIVKRIPEGELLREFINHHNVTTDEPEIMEKIDGYRNKAHFHLIYFREVLKEHNINYSKSRPQIASERHFFDELDRRVSDTNHLNSFKEFLVLLDLINRQDSLGIVSS